MRVLLTRNACLAVLLVFLASFGMGAANPKWLAHHIGHELAHAHPDVDERGGTGAFDGFPSDDAEHSAMHAAVQLVSMTTGDFHWQPAVTVRVVRSSPVPPQVIRVAFDAPFRPPRRQPA